MANDDINPLIFDLVEPILVWALRSNVIVSCARANRHLLALLNVIGWRTIPSLRQAALMQMWWFDLDFVCEKNLPVDFLKLQLDLWPARPLQYVPDMGIRWAMLHHRADLLDWWAKHQGGPLFFSRDAFDRHLHCVSNGGGSRRPSTPLDSPRVLETLKWFCKHRSGVDLDSDNLQDLTRSFSPMQQDLVVEALTKMLNTVLKTGHRLSLFAAIGHILSALQVRLTNDYAWLDACATGDLVAVYWMEEFCHPPANYHLDAMLGAACASGNTEVIEWCLQQAKDRQVCLDFDRLHYTGTLVFNGHVHLLEKWLASRPKVSLIKRIAGFMHDLVGARNHRVCRITLVPIAEGGCVEVLKWWLLHHKQAGVEFLDTNLVHLAASRANQRAVLEWWSESSGFALSAADAVEGVKSAIVGGHVDVLDFWYSLSEERAWSLKWDFKITDYATLDIASSKGHVDVLRWWKSKGLPIDFTAFAIDMASQRGHIQVLDWWLRESGLSKDRLKYGTRAMYFSDELPESCIADDVIRWWQDSGLDLWPICDDPDCCRSFLWRLLNRYGPLPGKPKYVTKPLLLEVQRKAGVPMDYVSLAQNTLSAAVLDWCRNRAPPGQFPFTAGNMPEKWAQVQEWWTRCGLVVDPSN